ncbi:MAG: hypothetical protein QNJ60_13575, partial [Xenococcaceae cyanobacterium MO_188.B19]|nr:hypothetical protein [Xenococcaceae cyanobacterium MO_188.B19]
MSVVSLFPVTMETRTRKQSPKYSVLIEKISEKFSKMKQEILNLIKEFSQKHCTYDNKNLQEILL